MLRHTRTYPPLYYVHSENDLAREGAAGAYGLSAYYISMNSSAPNERGLWTHIFRKRWSDACFSLAQGLREIGVDAFALVPCTRTEVVMPLRMAFVLNGLIELPRLITKTDSEISFAGKGSSFIAKNTLVNVDPDRLRRVQALAVCDDFAATGKTLFGVYEMLTAEVAFITKRIVLAAAGVSSQLVISEHERHER